MNNNQSQKQTKLLIWIIVPFLLASLLNGFVISVVRASVSTIEQVFVTSEYLPVIDKFDGQSTGFVTFWFDDAWKSEYTEGLSQLTRAGYVGSIAVPTELVGYPAYMTWEQIIELQDKGWEINSHSRAHNCEPGELDKVGLLSEILGAKYDLRDRNLYNNIYVPPCGVESPEILELVKENYSALRISESGINEVPLLDRYALKSNSLSQETTIDEVKEWIAEAERTKGWLNLMFHAVTANEAEPEYDFYAVSPDFLTEVIKEVKDSELNVVVPSEVLAITE